MFLNILFKQSFWAVFDKNFRPAWRALRLVQIIHCAAVGAALVSVAVSWGSVAHAQAVKPSANKAPPKCSSYTRTFPCVRDDDYPLTLVMPHPSFSRVVEEYVVDNMPRVRNQGGSGACEAFSWTTLLQFELCRINGWDCKNLRPEQEISDLNFYTRVQWESDNNGKKWRRIETGTSDFLVPRRPLLSNACAPWTVVTNDSPSSMELSMELVEQEWAMWKRLEEARMKVSHLFRVVGCKECAKKAAQEGVSREIQAGLLRIGHRSELDQLAPLVRTSFDEMQAELLVPRNCHSEQTIAPDAFQNVIQYQARDFGVADAREHLKERKVPFLAAIQDIRPCPHNPALKCQMVSAGHQMVVSGYRKACDNKGNCVDLLQVHNSWGAAWQEATNGGWHLATSVLPLPRGGAVNGVHLVSVPLTESDAWRNAQNALTGDEVDRLYLNHYPHGPNADQARALRAKLAERDARGLAVPSWKDCPECPELVKIPSGKFLMGYATRDLELLKQRYDLLDGKAQTPQHEVTIKRPFAMGREAVTGAQWQAVMGADGRNAELCGDDCPVTRITWFEAQEYARRLSERTGFKYRLPTEAEREYAARAGTQTLFWWGNAISPSVAAYGGENFGAQYENYVTPGDVKKIMWHVRPGANGPTGTSGYPANPWGLFHVVGNIGEWVEDCFHPTYHGAPVDGTARLSADCDKRSVRGGNPIGSIELLPIASRSYRERSPGSRASNVGLRVVRELKP